MKRIFATLLTVGFIVGMLNPLQVSAAEKLTLRKLQENYNAEKAKYDANQKQINLTNAQINEKKARINTLKKEMLAISSEVVKLNDEIDEYKLKIKDKIIESKTLLEQFQMTDNSSLYYDYIFNADNVSDMTYRSAVIKEIVEYNDKMVVTLNDMISANNKRQEEIEKRKVEINSLESELNANVAALGEAKSQLSVGSLSISKQMNEIQSNINYYKKVGCKLDDVIGVDCNRNFSAGPLRRPTTAGYVTQNHVLYSSGYFHRGLDISSSNGKREKIYPVAGGTVAGVEIDSYGALVVRINHTINGQHYTSFYGHLSSFAPGLKKGKQVTSNDYIGYMGNTGKSSGTHLHIEMYACWVYSDAACLTWSRYTSFALAQYKKGYNLRNMIPVTNGLYNKWTWR